MIAALNVLKGMIPGAMAGAIGVGLFIAELGAIFAALGALEQFTGASNFINSAGDLLQSLGTSIDNLSAVLSVVLPREQHQHFLKLEPV